MKIIKKSICIILTVILALSSLAVFSFAADVGMTGTFNVINYNIAGLPIPASMAGHNRDALSDDVLIGKKINEAKFDIVGVQEDFNFDQYFRAELTNYENVTSGSTVKECHQSETSGGVPSGDGLNIFSLYNLYNIKRVEWKESMDSFDSNGDGNASIGELEGDSLTPKGFMVATIEPEKGYYIDVYDLHADAFGGESYQIRAKQFTQLANYIMKHSVYDETTGCYDHGVIVVGDFNAFIMEEGNTNSDSKLLPNLIEAAHLNDAWAVNTLENISENVSDKNYSYRPYYDYVKTMAGVTNIWDESTGLIGHYDSIERILYASGNGIKISLTDKGDSFKYENWKNEEGYSLSDHCNAQAKFTYTIVDKVQDTSSSHDSTTTPQRTGFLFKFLKAIGSLLETLGRIFQLPGFEQAAQKLMKGG